MSVEVMLPNQHRQHSHLNDKISGEGTTQTLAQAKENLLSSISKAQDALHKQMRAQPTEPSTAVARPTGTEKRFPLSPIGANDLNTKQPFPKPLTTSKSAHRPNIIHPIPRHAEKPDVFAPFEPIQPNSRHVLGTSSNATNIKRTAADIQNVLPSQKRSKVDREVAETSASRHRAEEERWKSKWMKAFPTLVFHFEIGSDINQRKAVIERVTSMGAKVDQFFSTRVTHVIVKSLASPSKTKSRSKPPSTAAGLKSPKNPFLDNTGSTDLVTKAEALNMKVWTMDKLSAIVSRLAPTQIRATDSLHTLLEDEKVHGTRERDLSAPRTDHYYFKPGNKYLLVEDATKRHRTILVKEYQSNPKNALPEWPTLFETFLRPSASNQYSIKASEARDRAWALYVDRVPYKDEHPPIEEDAEDSPVISTMPRPPEPTPYQAASGNSVVITSNIASTSTAGRSPAISGPSALGFGNPKERAIYQMSKRIQVLKGNAKMAAAKRQNSLPSLDVVCERRGSGDSSAGPSRPQKVFMTQEQVIKMLRKVKGPIVEDEVTAEMRIENRAKVDAGQKVNEQETASGYCENCRIRYSDLSVHMTSKKHRKFARDDSNFAELDRLLDSLQRPLNPRNNVRDYAPCWRKHGKDDPCDDCGIPAVETEAKIQELCPAPGHD